MQTIHMLERTGKDGTLLLRISLDQAEAENEVVVVVQPKDRATKPTPPEERGWPLGYFENTFGSITDDTFERPPQGELPKAIDLK